MIKKIAMNKIATMYKVFHATYLELITSIFGDDFNDPSVIKQFEKFGINIGMWENIKPNEKEEKKYTKSIKTQYVFDAEDFNKFKDKFFPVVKK